MDLIDVSLGLLLAAIGLAGATLAAFYWAGGGMTLLSFGLFAFGYGATLVLGSDAVTSAIGLSPSAQLHAQAFFSYWMVVPGVLFAEQIRGPGWRSSLRLIWQVWIGLAATLTVYDWATATPFANGDIYQLCVLVMLIIVLAHVVAGETSEGAAERRIRLVGSGLLLSLFLHDNLVALGILPWQLSLQNLGVTAFVFSLGLVTVQRFFTNQRELVIVEHEMSPAREIQASILPRQPPALSGLTITVRYAPMRSVAGDMYDFVVVDDHHVGMLVADVTGHGVPAALIASMSKVAFSAQADCAAEPGALLAGMNSALCGSRFERRFVTASYVYLDTEARALSYSSAGHPAPLLLRATTREVVELTGGAMFLGFRRSTVYPTREVELQPGDRLVVYTDGVTEAADPSGAFFDRAGLEEFLASNSGLGTDAFADALMAHLRRWAGHASDDQPFADDVTLAVLDVE